MRKLVLVLTAVLLVFAVSAPAFAIGVENPIGYDGSNPWINPGEGGWSGDDDSDHHHSSSSSSSTTNETTTVTPDSTSDTTAMVVASVSQDVNRLLTVTNTADALLAVAATVPASLKNQNNVFTFQADALKTATGEAPATLPFILYKIVGDQYIELTYGVDYIIDWKAGQITIYNVTDDCEFLFVPAA